MAIEKESRELKAKEGGESQSHRWAHQCQNCPNSKLLMLVNRKVSDQRRAWSTFDFVTPASIFILETWYHLEQISCTKCGTTLTCSVYNSQSGNAEGANGARVGSVNFGRAPFFVLKLTHVEKKVYPFSPPFFVHSTYTIMVHSALSRLFVTTVY